MYWPSGLLMLEQILASRALAGDAGRDGDAGLLADARAHLGHGVGRRHAAVLGAVGRDVEVGLVDAGALEAAVILGKHLAHLVRLGDVLVEVGLQQHQLRAQLLGHEAGHAAAAAEPPRQVVARRQHAAAHGERHVRELGPVQLLHGRVEGVAVDVHDVLRQVARQLQLGHQLVCLSQLVRDDVAASLPLLLILLLQTGFPGEYVLDLGREDLVLLLLAVEVLGALEAS